MSQDRGEPADTPRDGEDEPDRTQAFDPRSEPDRTQAFDPRSEDVQPTGEPDQTRAFDPRSRSESTRQQPPTSPAWSGRAGVPPPRPSAGPAEQTGWGEYDSSGGRPWWTPILIGLVGLILLGVLGTALWLAWDRTDREAPVNPTPSVASPKQTPTPTPSPTETTGRPTPSRTSAAPIPVPPLVGLTLQPAQALLDDLGLKSRLQFVPSDRTAGTVVDTDPGAGALVDRGDTITLVVAQPRRSLPVSPATPPAPGQPS